LNRLTAVFFIAKRPDKKTRHPLGVSGGICASEIRDNDSSQTHCITAHKAAESRPPTSICTRLLLIASARSRQGRIMLPAAGYLLMAVRRLLNTEPATKTRSVVLSSFRMSASLASALSASAALTSSNSSSQPPYVSNADCSGSDLSRAAMCLPFLKKQKSCLVYSMNQLTVRGNVSEVA